MRKRLLLYLSIILAAGTLSFGQRDASSQFRFLDSIFTKDHYQVELLDVKKKGPAEVKETGSVHVNRHAQLLTFTTADKDLQFFESLKIDLRQEVILYRNDTIPFLDEVNVPATSPFGEWNGYTWLKSSSSTDDSEVIIIDKQSSTITQVDFGKVRNTNKVLLRITYKEIEQGRSKVQFNVACYLN